MNYQRGERTMTEEAWFNPGQDRLIGAFVAAVEAAGENSSKEVVTSAVRYIANIVGAMPSAMREDVGREIIRMMEYALAHVEKWPEPEETDGMTDDELHRALS
jgi:hypothetical protein